MATRFYFNTTTQSDLSATVSTAFAGSYGGFNRYFLESTPTSAFSTQTNTASFSNGQAYCFGQWWSHPISNASSFAGTDWNTSTWTFLMRHSESSASANYAYRLQLRIWDGSAIDWSNNTFGATEFDVGDGSATNSLMESRRCSGCDVFTTPTNAPYADGQCRLVVELGIHRLSGTAASFTAYTEVGGNSGTDLSNDQTGTSQFNPWLETSLNFTFDSEPSEDAVLSKQMMMGAGR